MKKWHKALAVMAVLAVSFVPFPTEMVPEWRLRFETEEGGPLASVVVQQGWRSYTYPVSRGYEQRCTDSDGVVIFPKRYLWAGLISRIVFPVLAEAMTLAHGSTGTDAYVQVFDRNFISENYYWRDRMSFYAHNPDPSMADGGRVERLSRERSDIAACPGLR